MNRDTQRVVLSPTRGVTTGNALWETPPEIFAKLDDEFGFDVDLTSDSTRTLCRRWLGPDALSTNARDAVCAQWMRFGRVGYSNPPYGPFIGQILPKAKLEAAQGFTSVFLLPLRITRAFRAHILAGAAEVRFCDKRITFYENGAPRLDKKGRPQPAPFDSIIVVYRHAHVSQSVSPLFGRLSLPASPHFSVWEVPPHV